MKKYILFLSLFSLAGCASNSAPYCEQYIYKTNNSATKLFLKDGTLQKETSLKEKSFSEEGLFTYEDQTIYFFIKNKKESYLVKNNQLVSTNSPHKIFKCY